MDKTMLALNLTRAGRHGRLLGFALLCGVALLGCHQDMWNQPRYKTHAKNDFFANKSAARMPVEGTVRYDGARRPWADPVYAEITGEATVPPVTDDRFWTGRVGEGFVADNYFKVSPELLARGKARYEITCTPCHGMVGDGKGVIVSRGFPLPVSYHQDRLREVEDGYYFDVITNGFGRMYSYAARVAPEDRWAIAAYIRALQYSQNAQLAELAPADREAILHPKQADQHDGHAADHHAH
jgi:cytochrome c553